MDSLASANAIGRAGGGKKERKEGEKNNNNNTRRGFAFKMMQERHKSCQLKRANRAPPSVSSLPFALLSPATHRGCGVYIRRRAMFMETRLRGGRGRNNKGVNREKKWADAVGTKKER